MKNREKRFSRGKIECRAVTPEQIAAGYIGVIEGFIKYEADSRELRDNRGKPFIERLARGVFGKSIADASHEILADVGHSDAAIFARRGVNMDVVEREDGFAYTALIPDTSVGRDLKRNVELGIINGTSFEFELRASAGNETISKRDGNTIRTINDAVLHRVNPVSQPAYIETELAARSVSLPEDGTTPAPISHNSTGLVGALVGFF